MVNSSAFVDSDNLAHDSVFLQKVRFAMVRAGISVQSEAIDTANHTNRANYAKLVLNTPDSYTAQFSIAILAAPSVFLNADSPDADIAFGVNSVWNALCGVL